MKKLILILAICSLFFAVSCGGNSKSGTADHHETGDADSAADEDADSEDARTDSDITESGDSASTPDNGDSATDEDAAQTDSGNSEHDADAGSHDTTDADSGESEKTVSCSELDGISGELTTCVNGECETDDCPGSNSCKNATECGECRNYEEECMEKDSGWGIYRCKVGTYSLVKECAQGCNESWDDCGIIECENGTTKCVDGNDGRGETYTCLSGKWERDVDIDDYGNITEMKCTGSCNRKGTSCGESGCLNYTKECRDDLLKDSTHGGAIAECQFGKWEILTACTDAISCEDANNCGECKNGSTKCIDVEVSNIMNRNCDYKGNCERDSNGNLKYFSATVGVKLSCYDGRWSDPYDLTRSSYCPAVEHIFRSYKYGYNLVDWSTEMTHVFRGESTYDDFHYSSCHNDECGECHNSFVVCSDENTGGKLLGHIYNCQSGVLVYNHKCENQLCKNRYQCP